MQTIPNSTLYLCKNVDLDPNYNYTIDFDNITAQANYFDSKIATEFEINEGYSYVRDTQALKVQAKVDDLLGINYLFYNNGNKRYYAFITKKEYVSETCTKIDFKLDVLQSFIFNYEIDESFVEREHQDRFNLVNNVLTPIYSKTDENIDLGKVYKVIESNIIKNDNRASNLQDVNIAWYTIVCSDKLLQNETITNMYGVHSGYYIYFLPVVIGNNGGYHFTFSGTDLETDITEITKNTKTLAIFLSKYTPFSVDYSLVGTDRIEVNLNGSEWSGLVVGSTTGYRVISAGSLKVSQPREFFNRNIFTESTPSINNLKQMKYETKLLTSPYSKLIVRANEDKAEFAIEEFTNNIKLTMGFDYSYNNKMLIKPKDYLGGNLDNVVISTNNNELALLNDAWRNYEAQNKASLRSGILTSGALAGAGVILGVATGGIGLAVTGGAILSQASQITNEIIKRHNIQETPDSLKKAMGSVVVDRLIKDNNMLVELHEIDNEHKVRVYNYLYHYGYKCNDFKKPNTRSRYYFNYIKTIGANIKTNIDADFRAEIENAYNNGITIWHYRNATTFKGVNNYNYENVEINLMED